MAEPLPLFKTGNMIQFPQLASAGLVHAVFTRHGGVSPPPWDSNNVSPGLGDPLQNVSVNREKIKAALGLEKLISAKQVHGSGVHCVDTDPGSDLEVAGCDALITRVPGIGLMIQQADCQAIFLYDREKRSIGIVHAGWRGTVADIISETIFSMGRAFSTDPTDIVAAISPSLGPCCAEFVNFRTELPESLHGYQVKPGYFDFWAISRDQLCSRGVRPENIHISGICTCCSSDFFSYRREKNTGRFGSIIGIR